MAIFAWNTTFSNEKVVTKMSERKVNKKSYQKSTKVNDALINFCLNFLLFRAVK